MLDLNFIYCEATPLFGIAQPWNALSSLIFILLAYRLWQEPSAKWHRYGLILIAVASAAWHTSGIVWLLWFDIAAIALWLLLYAMDVSRCFGQSSLRYLILAIVLLIVSFLVTMSLKSALPMLSGAFVPYLAILLTLGATWPGGTTIKRAFLLSGVAMLLAIVLREVDMAVCSMIPVGTHWLWHVLAAASLFGPIYALAMVYQKRRG